MGAFDNFQGQPYNFLSASRTLLGAINEGNEEEVVFAAKSWLKDIDNMVKKPLINTPSKYLAAILYLYSTKNILSEQVLHASYLFLNALNAHNNYYMVDT